MVDKLIGMLPHLHILQKLIYPLLLLLDGKMMKPGMKFQVLLHA
jgi:hypothetical protein